MNILDNAMKYTPQGTPIELLAAVKENNIIVKISDRGPGIPSGEEKRILEKFVRGTAKGVGIGLGLAVCDAIITSHGGRIWVENRPGGDRSFVLFCLLVNNLLGLRSRRMFEKKHFQKNGNRMAC